MTNQTQFKQDTQELYDKLTQYLREYDVEQNGRFSTGGLIQAKSTLRTFLYICNSDEEDKQQKRSDSMC